MKTYLINGSVLDCVSADMKPFRATVVIEKGKITAIDRAGSAPPPDAANVIDLGGAFLMPGLWDSHCHPGGMIPDVARVSYFETAPDRTLRAVRNTQSALYVGVTALRAVGESNFIDLSLRDAYANKTPTGLWKKGYDDKRLMGPRIFGAGPGLRITGGHGANGRVAPMYTDMAAEVDSPDEIRKFVRYCMKMGTDWIKLCITGGIAGIRESMYELQMDYEDIKAACDAAHKKNVKVCAHTGCSEAAIVGVKAGLDSIEHGYELNSEATDLMAERGTYYCPTLSVTMDEAYMRRWEWPEHSLRRALEGAELHRKAFENALRSGVTIVNGADLNPIAETAIPEIEWVVKAGMSTGAALLASTRNPAQMCDVLETVGTVEVGKWADLIVTDKNPLDNISALRSVQLVMKEGDIVVNKLAATERVMA